VPRSAEQSAHLIVHDPEAAVVQRIFDDFVAAGHSIREITRRLNADGVATPTGKPVWGTSTVGRLLTNEAYIGTVYWNKTESIPDPVLDGTTARSAVTEPSGSRSTARRSSPRTSSPQHSSLAATTADGVRGALAPMSGYYAVSSAAAPAASG